jgi:guanyl-specific ribonuclease Sa
MLDLEMPKPDGSISKLSVARPLWWLQATNASVGGTIDIGMQEVGISGEAQVMKIKPCPHDSRDNEKGMNLVIGKIEHHNAEVWDLVFDGNSQKPLGVTANHPLFSVDRNDWVPAGELRINERVKALKGGGTSTLTAKSERPTRETVYNLEVHRSHAYHVAEQGLLVHNTGITCQTRFVTTPAGRTVDLRPTIDRINSGVRFPHRHDGSIFRNAQSKLPAMPAGHYREYVVPTPGVTGPGPMRLVVGNNGEIFFTLDHYLSFIPIH